MSTVQKLHTDGLLEPTYYAVQGANGAYVFTDDSTQQVVEIKPGTDNVAFLARHDDGCLYLHAMSYANHHVMPLRLFADCKEEVDALREQLNQKRENHPSHQEWSANYSRFSELAKGAYCLNLMQGEFADLNERWHPLPHFTGNIGHTFIFVEDRYDNDISPHPCYISEQPISTTEQFIEVVKEIATTSGLKEFAATLNNECQRFVWHNNEFVADTELRAEI